MLKDQALYEKPYIPESAFPIRIDRTDVKGCEAAFKSHWHEEFEFLYFTHGNAVVDCNSRQIHVQAGDLIIVNSNELHSCRSKGGELSYICIIVDPALLHSSIGDNCDVKYISPISQNLILFMNKVNGDPLISDCIMRLVAENEARGTGYELAIKSLVYNLLVLLLRGYVEEVFAPREYLLREKRLKQINVVLKHIEDNYIEDIRTAQLAKLINISEYYFCHLFKRATGKPLNEYINALRIAKADTLLKTTDLPVTEVALRSGFSDPNYFSRIYKKNKKYSPSDFRKRVQGRIESPGR